jgi:hypothetical protein
MDVGMPGPVDEQRHRFRPAVVSRMTRIGHGQRSQPVPRLAGHPQRLPAGGQHPDVIAGRQQAGAQPRGRVDDMLAVVQHQQQLLLGQRPGNRRGGRGSLLVVHPQRRRYG